MAVMAREERDNEVQLKRIERIRINDLSLSLMHSPHASATMQVHVNKDGPILC